MKNNPTRCATLIIALMLPCYLNAQLQTVIDWNNTETIVNDIKITTNIPDNVTVMPILNIDGYNYDNASNIGLKISWFQENGEIRNSTVSSYGGTTPRIFLNSESGHIVIFMLARDMKIFRFQITAFFQGMPHEDTWYSGWSIHDDTGDGREVIYNNEFGGDTRINGVLAAHSASLGSAAIGELTLDHVRGNFVAKGSPILTHPEVDGQVNLWADDGGIDIRSGNDNHSFIDFRGITYPYSAQGRILHSDGEGFKIFTAGISGSPKMVINNNGVIGIGNTTGLTSATSPYKLYVEGGVRTRKVKVDQVNWPDYVFEPSYKLTPLSSLENFIKVNKHLPDVPSVHDVTKDGSDVGDMQAVLLKKVEELTLYVIEQNKNQEKLSREIKEQKKTIEIQQQMLLKFKINFRK